MYFIRKFKLTDNQLTDLKQKYTGFSLTWFWEYKVKPRFYPKKIWSAYCFHNKMIGDMFYNTPTIPTRKFENRDKNLNQNFAAFLNSKVKEPNQILELKPTSTMTAQLNKTSNHVLHLLKEIDDINKYKIEQENYFLYDNSNIETTFFSELNKKIQIYSDI